MNPDSLSTNLARLGAPLRLQAIEKELQAMFALFPDLFPSGMPVITKPQLRAKALRAEELVRGAEEMHRKAKANGNGHNHKVGRPKSNGKRGKYTKPIPATEEERQKLREQGLLIISEASRYLGVTSGTIYNRVVAGKLSVADHKGRKHASRFRVEDLDKLTFSEPGAFLKNRAILARQEANATTVEQPVEQPVGDPSQPIDTGEGAGV